MSIPHGRGFESGYATGGVQAAFLVFLAFFFAAFLAGAFAVFFAAFLAAGFFAAFFFLAMAMVVSVKKADMIQPS